MIQKNYKPTIPTKRFFTNIVFIERQSVCASQLIKKKKSVLNRSINRHYVVRGVRRIKRAPVVGYYANLNRNTQYVSTATAFSKLFLRSYIQYTNVFNQRLFTPRLTSSFVGNIVYLHLATHFLTWQLYAPNMLIVLYLVPHNTPVCFLKNLKNTKSTYACSTGSTATKVKGKKRHKLVAIALPSQKLCYLLGLSECLVGSSCGEALSGSVLGRFSSNLKRKYTTKVRGVAMNPVDHPNGGRTKSKSPELSPWGWIAKNNN